MSIDFKTELGKIKILMLKGEKGDAGQDGSSGDYSQLTNKPTINGVTVNGAMTSDDLGVASQTALNSLSDDFYNNNIGDVITIEKTNIASIGFSVNYTFPCDGYLVCHDYNYSGLAYMMSCDMKLNNKVSLGNILRAKIDENTPLAIPCCIYVKKGMVLSGQMAFATQSMRDNYDVLFYPFQ